MSKLESNSNVTLQPIMSVPGNLKETDPSVSGARASDIVESAWTSYSPPVVKLGKFEFTSHVESRDPKSVEEVKKQYHINYWKNGDEFFPFIPIHNFEVLFF